MNQPRHTPGSEIPPLSLQQRAIGKKRYYLFSAFNSISFAVLAESLVILMILRLGGDESWVGAVSAMLYVMLPFMLVGYKLIPRLGVTGTAALFWVLRSCSALPMILAPLAAARLGGTAGLWFMFAGTLGFTLGRAGGLTSFTGIITELTTRRDRGELISANFRIFQSGAILATVMVALFLGEDAPLFHYQLFFCAGLACGLMASWALWRIPEAGLFRATPPFSPRKELRWILASGGRRWFFAMMLAVPVTQGLFRAFLLVAFKQGYGLSDQSAVLLVLAGMVGGVLASYSYGMFMDQLGSRPLLFITGFLDMLAVGLVVFLPATFSWPLAVAIFFLNGYGHTALQAATQHYFISITDYEHQLPQGILTQGAGGLVGGVTLFAGGLVLAELKPLAAEGSDALLHFRWFFGGLLALLALRTVIIFRIPSLRSQGIRDSLNALFSPWDWRAIHAVKRAISSSSEAEEERALAALTRSSTGIYQEDLERYLQSPSLFVRRRALDSLFLAKPTPSLIGILREDLQRNPFTTAHQSAYWLGHWRVEAAIPALRDAMSSEDFRLAGSALHSLVELDDRESLPYVEAAFALSDNPYLLIEGGRALSIWGDSSHYALLLHKYHLDIPPQAKDELSLSVARLLGLYNDFYRDLGMLHRESAQLFQEWRERMGALDGDGLIPALRSGEPRRSLLEATLERRGEEYRDWFRTATRDFLARRPEKVWPEMAFLMTFLLLARDGQHLDGQGG